MKIPKVGLGDAIKMHAKRQTTKAGNTSCRNMANMKPKPKTVTKTAEKIASQATHTNAYSRQPKLKTKKPRTGKICMHIYKLSLGKVRLTAVQSEKRFAKKKCRIPRLFLMLGKSILKMLVYREHFVKLNNILSVC